MEPEKLVFKIVIDGKDVDCEALFTVEDDETGSTYMVYTDHTTTDDGMIKTYAGRYDGDFKDDGSPITLKPIETEKEWKLIESTFEILQKEAGGETGE